MARVRGHYRNGRWVRAHYRRSPRRRTAGIAGVVVGVVLLVLVVLAVQALT